MTTFTATICHHSISRARVIDCGDDLTIAKAIASKEFGNDFRDYCITISGQRPGCAPELYAERKVGARKWINK